MAIFHYTIKIVGRSKGKSVISASAYLNGDVMKNEETGSISYYTSKKEVVYTSLMMCENAPSEWQIVPEENIKRFQKSVRYKRSEDKEAAIKKFKITFQKQRLWNEVLKIEKNADASGHGGSGSDHLERYTEYYKRYGYLCNTQRRDIP